MGDDVSVPMEALQGYLIADDDEIKTLWSHIGMHMPVIGGVVDTAGLGEHCWLSWRPINYTETLNKALQESWRLQEQCTNELKIARNAIRLQSKTIKRLQAQVCRRLLWRSSYVCALATYLQQHKHMPLPHMPTTPTHTHPPPHTHKPYVLHPTQQNLVGAPSSPAAHSQRTAMVGGAADHHHLGAADHDGTPHIIQQHGQGVLVPQRRAKRTVDVVVVDEEEDAGMCLYFVCVFCMWLYGRGVDEVLRIVVGGMGT